jgi:rhamnosyl/mannosyltransferase
MKILQLTKFYPPVRGGIETTTYELTEGINLLGCRADVLCANQRPLTTREHSPAGYDITRAASAGRFLSVSMAPSLIREARQRLPAYDVVHVHMPDPLAALALWTARPEATIVVHWHSDVVRQRVAMHLYEPLQRWLLNRADAVIATSRPYAQASRPLQPWMDKLNIVPIGIRDLSSRLPLAQDTLVRLRQQYAGKRVVFALGRFAGYKGFDLLVDAAALLPEDVVVVIGGSGDEMIRALQKRALLRGAQDRVVFPGDIADEELPAYFAAADVFCLPSTTRAEAFGVAMLEAMSMGKPVVATRIEGSGVSWVNHDGQTGINVEPGNAQALVSGLQAVLDDRALALRLGDAARRRYLDEFTNTVMSQRIVELYKSVRQERAERKRANLRLAFSASAEAAAERVRERRRRA